MMNKGLMLMACGIVCFYFGLDEFWDYLRIFHGLWHLLVGLSSLFTW